MKIALVSPYDFVYPGGVANHILSLGRQLTQMGHLVKYIAPASKAITNHDLGDNLITIGRPSPIPTSGSIARVPISPSMVPGLKPILNEENFDIIHLHEPLMPMLSAGVLYHSHTINVGTFHAFDGTPGYNVLRPISDFVLGKLIQKLDRRIAVSRPAMEFVKKHFPGEYHITPNGVDTKHFNPEVSPIEQFCDGKLNILFVGRLEKRKGADYLVKAYKRLKRDIPNSRLIIVGPGTVLRSKYERAVEKNGLSDVVFAGFSSYEDLPRYYQTADVFCAPATGWESFGIILLEAMAVGKPVVASNIEGYAGVLTHGVEGLLVPPRNEEKLAEALATLLTDESMRREMGTNGIAKAKEYDWQNVARQIVEHYKIARAEFPYREKASTRRVLREKFNWFTPRKLRLNGKANPSS